MQWKINLYSENTENKNQYLFYKYTINQLILTVTGWCKNTLH